VPLYVPPTADSSSSSPAACFFEEDEEDLSSSPWLCQFVFVASFAFVNSLLTSVYVRFTSSGFPSVAELDLLVVSVVTTLLFFRRFLMLRVPVAFSSEEE